MTQAETPPGLGLVSAPVIDSPWSSSRRAIESPAEDVARVADQSGPAPRTPLSLPPANPSTHSEQPPRSTEVPAADVARVADQRSPALPSPLLPPPPGFLNPSTYSDPPLQSDETMTAQAQKKSTTLADNHESTTAPVQEKSTTLADNRDELTAPKPDRAEEAKSRIALAPGSSEIPEMMPVPAADAAKPLTDSRTTQGKTLSPRHNERMASRAVDPIYASPPPTAPAPPRRFLGLFTIENREPPTRPQWPQVTFPTSYYAANNTRADNPVRPALTSIILLLP